MKRPIAEPWARRAAVRCLLVALAACSLQARVPSIEYFYPAGGRQGAKFAIRVGGQLDPWPVDVWSDDEGLVLTPGESRGELQVEIAPQTRVGPHLVRLYNADGASEPHCFVVGPFPEMTPGSRPTREDESGILERFPVTLNGRLWSFEEAVPFMLRLTAGSVLHARVDGCKLDHPVPTSLVLLDSKGVKLATARDTNKCDPALDFRLDEAGLYRLEVMPDRAATAVRFEPGLAAVYRLTLTNQDAPPPRPPAVVSGERVNDQILRPFRIAQQVTLPSTIHSLIDPPGKEGRYVCALRKGEQFHCRVRAASVGSILLPVVSVCDEAGYALHRAGPAPDVEVLWVAPADGAYTVVVTDAEGRGGSDCNFDLELSATLPALAGAVSGHTFRLAPGGTFTLTVKASRPSYYEGPVIITLTGLPAGVAAVPGPVPPDGGEVTVTLTASAEAKPANQPFQVLLLAPTATVTQVGIAKAPLKGRYAAPGDLLINETDQLWLTVLSRDAGRP